MLYLSCIGEFKASINDKPITHFESDNVRALLVYLACESHRSHHRSQLAGFLWPDETEKTARNNLRQAIFKLQKAIKNQEANPPYLLISSQTVQFNPACAYEYDFNLIQKYFKSYRELPAGEKLGQAGLVLLIKAADLYTGPFLQAATWKTSDPFEEWVIIQREKLHRQVFLALDNIISHSVKTQNWSEAHRFASQQLTLDPWYEMGHRNMMTIFAAEGNHTAALQQFERCKKILQKELGVTPMPETTALYEKIKTNMRSAPTNTSLKQVTHTPAETKTGISHNLPQDLTTFIGREALIEKCLERLNNSPVRLTVLTGMGGIGKTRLAIEVGQRSLQNFPDGVWFIPLDGLPATSDANQLASAIGAGMQLPASTGNIKTQLHNYIRSREMLVICDNFENVSHLDFVIKDLLVQAPKLKMMITSRDGSPFTPNQILSVPPLTYPKNSAALEDVRHFEAMRLFMQHARQARSNLEISIMDEPFVTQICQHVEGLPLAIELAASWVTSLTCREIAQELQSGLRLLKDTTGRLPSRQAAISVVLDYSWRHLSLREQKVLICLAIFNGGFNRNAAKDIAFATLEDLQSLTQRSLLHFEPSSDQEPRYQLHELTRQFMHEKCTVDETIKKLINEAKVRHTAYYGELLADAQRLIGTAFFVKFVEIIAPEMDNIRSAWHQAIMNKDACFFSKAVKAFASILSTKSRYQEGAQHIQEALRVCEDSLPDLHHRDQANICHSAIALLRSRLVMMQNGLQTVSLPAVTKLAEQAYLTFQAQNDAVETAYACLQWGIALRREGKFNAAWDKLEAGLAIIEKPELLDKEPSYLGEIAWTTASLAGQLTMIAPQTGLHEKGELYGVKALRLFEAQGFQTGIWYAAYALGSLAMLQGHYEMSAMYVQIALDALQDLPLHYHRMNAWQLKGYLYYYMKDYRQAITAFQQAQESNHEVGDEDMRSNLLGILGQIALEQQKWGDAVKTAGQAESIARKTGHQWRLAQVLITLGLGYEYLNSTGLARKYLSESLEIAHALAEPNLQNLVLIALLEWLGKQGEQELAAQTADYLLGIKFLSKDKQSEVKALCSRFQIRIAKASELVGDNTNWHSIYTALRPKI